MIRTILLRAVTVLFSLLIGFGIAETAVRLVPTSPPPEDERVTERETGRFGQADLRDRGRPGSKQPGIFRILAVGDSFTWGTGVHARDAYPDVLERLLNGTTNGGRFEVVNWSRPGWTTTDEWYNVRRHFQQLDPDLLLIGFVLNDPEPRKPNNKAQVRRELDRRVPEHPASRWLHEHSALFKLLWERIENTRQRRAFSAYYHRLFEGDHWELCRSSLTRFQRRAVRAGIPAVLVVFPVFDSQLDDSYPYRELHATAARTAEEIGFHTLDLLDAYGDVDARDLALYPFTDPHPSRLAHRLTAERISEFLRQEGLLP